MLPELTIDGRTWEEVKKVGSCRTCAHFSSKDGMFLCKGKPLTIPPEFLDFDAFGRKCGSYLESNEKQKRSADELLLLYTLYYSEIVVPTKARADRYKAYGKE